MVNNIKYTNWLGGVLEVKNSNERIKIVNVYAPTLYVEKQYLWDNLLPLKNGNWHQQGIVVGDFNTTIYSSEHKGGNIIKYPFQ